MIIVRITIILQLGPPTKQLTPHCVHKRSTPSHHFRFFLQSRCHLSSTDCRQVSEQPTSTATAPRASSPSRTKLTWVSLSYNDIWFLSPPTVFWSFTKGLRSSPSFIPHVMAQTAFFGSRRARQQKRLKPLREFRTCLDWFLVVIKP